MRVERVFASTRMVFRTLLQYNYYFLNSLNRSCRRYIERRDTSIIV